MSAFCLFSYLFFSISFQKNTSSKYLLILSRWFINYQHWKKYLSHLQKNTTKILFRSALARNSSSQNTHSLLSWLVFALFEWFSWCADCWDLTCSCQWCPGTCQICCIFSSFASLLHSCIGCISHSSNERVVDEEHGGTTLDFSWFD